MSVHIEAAAGAIAETVLLPGDPLRAQFIAQTYLENYVCYNNVRNMFGFTGKYKGKRISVQGTGMGIPSISIYANELFKDYGVKRAIRIGTAGSVQKTVNVRDMIMVMAASTDSGANTRRFNGKSFAPAANFPLLLKAYKIACEKGLNPKTGTVLTSDMFYNEDEDSWKLWSKFGIMAIEMETAELYTLAAKYGREALSILTISDSLVTGEATSPQERQTTFSSMMDVALETAICEG
ncbi:purine nucleoside phosphorylase DeoD-type [Spirochaetia bacterium]|nr:purine nucleoside phosphorylase DeoD-type [Spirochaetia bacterium]